MNLDTKFEQIILKLVNKRLPHLRKPTYSNEYFLHNMCFMLNNHVSWTSLSTQHEGKPKNHYKTIYHKFVLWRNNNIFKDAYDKILKKYCLKDINSTSTINLFIDSTSIANKSGIELINFNETRKKKVTKVSVVGNDHILGITFHDAAAHDVKTIEKSVEDITKKIKFRKINLT